MKKLLDLTALVCFFAAVTCTAIGIYPLAVGFVFIGGIAALIEFVSF